MAPENCVYGGYELLQALLSAGLRYGKQRIFHRHTHKDGRGDILFHCASATEPGVFDLTKMGSFTSKGLCFFFSATPSEDSMTTFDCLMEMLDQLIEDLGGQVLDDRRELLTKEKMLNYRQKIRAIQCTVNSDQ
jgi:cell division protein ZipA